MNLEQASLAALEAARAGDLNSVTIALDARQRAIQAGEAATPLALYAGEQTSQLLRDLVQQMHGDSERLRQLQKFSLAGDASHVEVRG